MKRNEAEPLISISECARQLGLHKSTLSRQIAQKRIRTHAGGVRLSEVRADRSATIPMRSVSRVANRARLYIDTYKKRHDNEYMALVETIEPLLLKSNSADFMGAAFSLCLVLLVYCVVYEEEDKVDDTSGWTWDEGEAVENGAAAEAAAAVRRIISQQLCTQRELIAQRRGQLRK
ncbi:hypothetical protein [Bradyrhizobium sp. BRP56]|uniref:hypothetical protein n=1 Tax=Bradyrhizobium sp. BRP56 TaxID=2793819 RepID=UPI001CD2324C|nr:hypothetical protein [Bradyrhizobium sp. BRP56]MCA1399354.1 hypothetical protein [Bradyrhizobium sp. BRP56]